jgi:spermidine/putrescine transport system ATP-binding protein
MKAADGYAVELRRVTKRFGETVALDDVTLQIRDGEFFSMLGPSGCGKTTSLRLMAGFETPTEGEVCIDGVAQGRRPPYQRPVNTVFQNYALFPHMTVYQNTAFGLEMSHVQGADIRQRVREALEMVQLPGKEDRTPRQLSGGQQQRVALARALVNRPKVLLLDEPLGALDLKLRKAMQFELKALQERVGITFVYVTHDQEEALTMSDRIAVMNLGHVLQVGSPAGIYEHPASRFVADFIGETNFLEGQVASLEGDLANVAVDNFRVAATFGQRPSVGQAVTVAVRPEKIRLSRQPLEGPNSFEGRVEEMTYVGKDSDYRVGIGHAVRLRVRVQNQTASSEGPAAGEAVWVQWPPSSARLLQE